MPTDARLVSATEQSLSAHEPDAAEPRDRIADGARLAALRDLGILDTEPEEAFDRFTRLAADLLGVPVALVSLVDRDRQFFKSQQGLQAPWAEARQTPLSHSFCQYAVDSKRPLVIEDARESGLVSDSLAIRDLDLIAYAGVPLVLEDGNAVGTLLRDRPSAAPVDQVRAARAPGSGRRRSPPSSTCGAPCRAEPQRPAHRAAQPGADGGVLRPPAGRASRPPSAGPGDRRRRRRRRSTGPTASAMPTGSSSASRGGSPGSCPPTTSSAGSAPTHSSSSAPTSRTRARPWSWRSRSARRICGETLTVEGDSLSIGVTVGIAYGDADDDRRGTRRSGRAGLRDATAAAGRSRSRRRRGARGVRGAASGSAARCAVRSHRERDHRRLPADRRPRDRTHPRLRGAGALAPPRARRGQSRPTSSRSPRSAATWCRSASTCCAPPAGSSAAGARSSTTSCA